MPVDPLSIGLPPLPGTGGGLSIGMPPTVGAASRAIGGSGLGDGGLEGLTEEERNSIFSEIGRKGTSAVVGAANILSLPSSSILDILAGKNPADQYLTPTSGENRTTGREILRQWGAIGKKDTWGNFLGGLALEIATDPLTYVGGAGLYTRATKAAAVLSKSGHGGRLAALASKAKIGTRQAGLTKNLDDIIKETTEGIEGHGFTMQSAERSSLINDLTKHAKHEGTTLDAIRHEPLAGIGQIGIPGSKKAKLVLGKGGGRGGWALPIARSMDKAQSAIVGSKPGRYLKAKLYTPVAGATSKLMQKLAPISTVAENEASQSARRIIVPTLDGFTRDGLFDPKLSKHTMPGADTVTGESAVNLNSNAVMDYMEEAGDNWHQLPEELKGYEKDFHGIKDELGKLRGDAEYAGLDITDLMDMLIKYNPRVPHFFASRTKSGKKLKRVLDPRDPHAAGRNPVLKEWAGGTSFLQRLSIDPIVSGIAHNMGYVDNIIPKDAIAKAARYILSKYHKDIVSRIGGHQKRFDWFIPKRESRVIFNGNEHVVEKVTEKLIFLKGQEQGVAKNLVRVADPMKGFATMGPLTKEPKQLVEGVEKLAEFMMRLDPKHAVNKVPLFKTNPIEAWLSRLEHGKRSISAANFITTTLSDLIKDGIGGVPGGMKISGNMSIAQALGKLQVDGKLNTGVVLSKLGKDKSLMKALGVDEITDDILEKRLFLDPEVVEDMSKYMGSFTRPESVKGLLRAIDMFTNMFKTGVTAWPSFHARN